MTKQIVGQIQGGKCAAEQRWAGVSTAPEMPGESESALLTYLRRLLGVPKGA